MRASFFLPPALACCLLGCTSTPKAPLVSVTYTCFRSDAPAPIDGWDLSYVSSTTTLTGDGRTGDSGCGHIPTARLRAVREVLESPSFLTAFAGAAEPTAEPHQAPRADFVSVVVGDRIANFERASIPEPVRRLLDRVAHAWAHACHQPVRPRATFPLCPGAT